MQRREWHISIAPRMPKHRRRLHLHLYEVSNSIQGVSKQISCPLKRAKQVPQHREFAGFYLSEEDRGPLRFVDTSLHGGGFKVGVDLLVDLDEPALGA